MKNFSKSAIAMAAVLAFVANAHDHSKGVKTAYGEVVKNSQGDCVVTAYNKDLKECGAKVVAPPTPKAPQIITETITMDAKTLFDTDRAVLRPEGKKRLKEFARKVKSAEASKTIKNITNINVAGHTDSRGTDAYNQRLSERRAASVRNYLIQQGINPSMISAVGYGESQPVATNATAAGRQQNRRVEITVSGTKEVMKKK